MKTDVFLLLATIEERLRPLSVGKGGGTMAEGGYTLHVPDSFVFVVFKNLIYFVFVFFLTFLYLTVFVYLVFRAFALNNGSSPTPFAS